MEKYRLGNFVVFPSKNLLANDTEEIAITPKMMAVLVCLVKANGNTVTKDELIEKVWGDVAVTDSVLSRAIADLRKVFGESAKSSSLIKTIPKIGYCLNLPTQSLKSSSSIEKRPSQLDLPVRDSRPNNDKLLIGTTISIALMVLTYALIKGYLSANQMTSEPLRAPRYLTTNKNTTEFNPRFSAQATDVAYVEQFYKGKANLVIRSLINQSSRIIATGDKVFRSPAFSPDGKKLAYFEFSNSKCVIKISHIESFQKTFESKCPKSTSYSLDWHPREQKLLLTGLNLESYTENLLELDLNTGKQTFITHSKTPQTGLLFPRYSPDGKRVAALHYDPNAKIWKVITINLANKSIQPHYVENGFINQVVWKNEEQLYIAIASGVNEGVWRLDLETGKKTRALNSKPIDLDYAPINQNFLVIEENRDIGLAMFNLETQSHTQFNQSSRLEKMPSVSPDQQHLAYLSDRTNNLNIWLMDLETQTERQLTFFDEGNISDLKWHPLDNSLYFTRQLDGINQVYQVTLNQSLNRLFDESNNFRFLDWSVDGKTLYYLSDRQDESQKVFAKSMSDLTERVFLNFPINQLRATKEAVYYQKSHGQKINRVSLIDSAENSAELPISLSPISWEITSTHIFFSSGNSKNGIKLYEFSIADSSLRELTRLPLAWQRPNNAIGVNKNGSQVYYANLASRQRDLLLYKVSN